MELDVAAFDLYALNIRISYTVNDFKFMPFDQYK